MNGNLESKSYADENVFRQSRFRADSVGSCRRKLINKHITNSEKCALLENCASITNGVR